MPTAIAKLDDMALVQMVLAGRDECFAELVHRHTNMVKRRVVSIVRNSSDVDDVVQEVFFKAWRALPKFRADATLRTWLISIATNEALITYRREHRRNWESLDEFNTVACHGEPADKALIRGEETRAVRQAILELPPKYREVLILRDIEGLDSTATAERLQWTLATVKTRLFRSRAKLATALRRSPVRVLQAA